MNKKIIVFGSFLAVFLMVIVPNASAIESQTAINVDKLDLIQVFKKTDKNKLKNNEFDLIEIFNILLNIYGIISNFIWIFTDSEYAIGHLYYLIVHSLLLLYWIKSD